MNIHNQFTLKEHFAALTEKRSAIARTLEALEQIDSKNVTLDQINATLNEFNAYSNDTRLEESDLKKSKISLQTCLSDYINNARHQLKEIDWIVRELHI